MTTLAIDPGNQQSAYCLIDGHRLPLAFEKLSNEALIDLMQKEITGDYGPGRVVIEMVASYGMAVGADVFETCVWIGRFAQVAHAAGVEVELVKRIPVKMHHCHSVRASDGAVSQALVDRFAPGEPNHGKGTKKAPGFFHGFSGDVWQAFALAVYAVDTLETAA
jgi:hypothetical protein